MTSKLSEVRGVLRVAPAPGVFHHARVAPSAALAGVVQHFWLVRWDLRGCSPRTPETLPHPNVHLVIERGHTHIVGVQTGKFSRVLQGEGSVLGVKFRPGGFRPFLGRPVATLRDRRVPFRELFGLDAAALEHEVFRQQTDCAMVAAVERFLCNRLPPEDAQVERVANIVEAIAANPAIASVEQLVDGGHIAKRALQSLFHDYVGVGPKWVIKRFRMHEALERLHALAPLNGTELALELGYFDQAHFIREFKTLVGRSPAAYARQSSAAPRSCAGQQKRN